MRTKQLPSYKYMLFTYRLRATDDYRTFLTSRFFECSSDLVASMVSSSSSSSSSSSHQSANRWRCPPCPNTAAASRTFVTRSPLYTLNLLIFHPVPCPSSPLSLSIASATVLPGLPEIADTTAPTSFLRTSTGLSNRRLNLFSPRSPDSALPRTTPAFSVSFACPRPFEATVTLDFPLSRERTLSGRRTSFLKCRTRAPPTRSSRAFCPVCSLWNL